MIYLKKTIAYYCHISLFCKDWLAQSLDFNLIENIQWIIKIQINAQHYQIFLLEIIKKIIKKKWEKLIKKIFYAYIKNMSK